MGRSSRYALCVLAGAACAGGTVPPPVGTAAGPAGQVEMPGRYGILPALGIRPDGTLHRTGSGEAGRACRAAARSERV